MGLNTADRGSVGDIVTSRAHHDREKVRWTNAILGTAAALLLRIGAAEADHYADCGHGGYGPGSSRCPPHAEYHSYGSPYSSVPSFSNYYGYLLGQAQMMQWEARQRYQAWLASLPPRLQEIERRLQEELRTNGEAGGPGYLEPTEENITAMMDAIGARPEERTFVAERLRQRHDDAVRSSEAFERFDRDVNAANEQLCRLANVCLPPIGGTP